MGASPRAFGGCLLVALLATATVGYSQATAGRPLRPAMLPFVGAGGFPRPRNIETGATDEGRVLLGGALDLPLGRRLLVASSVAYGIVPFVCLGGCPPAGTSVELALLWLATPSQGTWGALLGPSVGRTSFDGTRTGVGATISVGAVRGIGPRVSLRYHSLSGARHPTTLMGLLALRLGS